MQKVAFYSKWLDNPNGSVKDCPKNEMEQNETGTLLLAMPSDSAAGLLARMVKGVVSFLQNLLSPLTRKEGVRAEKVSRLRELSQTTAVGTLYGLLFAALVLAPLPRMEAQPYGGTGTTSFSTDCSPPPSFDFRWMDNYMSEEKKEEIFCALWDGETVTFRIMLQVPEIFGFLFPSLGVFRTFTVSNWEELNTVGYTLKDLVKEMADLEKEFQKLFKDLAKLERDKRTCDKNCAAVALGGIATCLVISAPMGPIGLAGCSAAVLIAEITCFVVCTNNYNNGLEDLNEDWEDLEDRWHALTN